MKGKKCADGGRTHDQGLNESAKLTPPSKDNSSTYAKGGMVKDKDSDCMMRGGRAKKHLGKACAKGGAVVSQPMSGAKKVTA